MCMCAYLYKKIKSMAFLPQRNYKEETLVSNYDLSSGLSAFTSSDLSEFNTLSVQFIYSTVVGSNIFNLEQSNDSTNWSDLSENYELPVSDGNFIIDKGTFSGKYVRVSITSSGEGTLTLKVLAKK